MITSIRKRKQVK